MNGLQPKIETQPKVIETQPEEPRDSSLTPTKIPQPNNVKMMKPTSGHQSKVKSKKEEEANYDDKRRHK